MHSTHCHAPVNEPSTISASQVDFVKPAGHFNVSVLDVGIHTIQARTAAGYPRTHTRIDQSTYTMPQEPLSN